MGRFTTPLRLAIQRCGLDLQRHSRTYEARRNRILARLDVQAIIDVGANTGQYAAELRHEGYFGRILSVEPLSGSYAFLERRCARDGAWDCLRSALGRQAGNQTINVAGNLTSSSILPMTALHTAAAPESAYCSTEIVEIRRLDEVAEAHDLLGMKLGLKLDVQGYELEVLAGGEQALQSAVIVETEVSFVELYKGQPLFLDIVSLLAENDFRPIALSQGFTDLNKDEALQANILFGRTASYRGRSL